MTTRPDTEADKGADGPAHTEKQGKGIKETIVTPYWVKSDLNSELDRASVFILA